MRRAGALWMLPLVLGLGAPARADVGVPTPPPSGHGEAPEAERGTPSRPSAPFADQPAADAGESIRLNVTDAKNEELARALSEALGTEVRIDGPMLRGITLQLDGVPRAEAMARIAAAVGATWRRTFAWTPGSERPTVDSRDTRTVSLHLTQAPCSSAAAIVASAAGAWAEGHEQLPGRVTLAQREMPLSQALEAIATQAGASWRELLVLRMPHFVAPKASQAKKPSKGGKTGESGRPRRTKYTVLSKYGAVAPPPVHVDPELAEARSKLGAFSGVFSLEDKEERLQRVRKMRAAMETQNRRLDNYRPEYRSLATRFELQQLQGILGDYERLNEEQKKEVKVLVDYVRKRLSKIQTLSVPAKK